MNIKTRLKKMEDQLIVPDAKSCQCGDGDEIHVLIPDLNEQRGYCRRCEGVCLFKPDSICEKCKKPVFSKYIKVEPKDKGEEYEC